MRNRSLARDLALIVVGALVGYFYATMGRQRLAGGMVPGLPDAASDLPTRVQRYYQTHTNEVIVGAILVAVILFLLMNGRGGGRKRR